MIEPPAPHGIAGIASRGGHLLRFFSLDPLLLVAAGSDLDAAPRDQSRDHAARWVNALDEQPAKDMLLQFLVGDTAIVKARLLAEIRDSQASNAWPTGDKQRTLEELLRRTAALRAEEAAKQARKAQRRAKQEASRAERERADRMKEMLENPDQWLRGSNRLVDLGGTRSYQAVAEILHDLREAIGGDKGDKIVRRHAAKLVKAHPTLNRLKSSLRKRGLFE
jgi:regulator of protease activity HflC (stomatin/prohibitin superfamily)